MCEDYIGSLEKLNEFIKLLFTNNVPCHCACVHDQANEISDWFGINSENTNVKKTDSVIV